MNVHVVRHPLVEDVLAALRDRHTPNAVFRQLAHRVSLLLVAEATRDLPVGEHTIETPLETATVRRVGARVVAVPVLRAGLGMLDALLELVPQAQVGYLGLERDETTAVARRYYEKMPRDLDGARVFLLDPMLATGGSAVMAIEGLAELGARQVRLLSIVAAWVPLTWASFTDHQLRSVRLSGKALDALRGRLSRDPLPLEESGMSAGEARDLRRALGIESRP